MIKDILFAGIGFVAGSFCPSLLRKIKSLLVKEATAAKTAVTAEVAKKL
jgi:hypothetical protein